MWNHGGTTLPRHSHHEPRAVTTKRQCCTFRAGKTSRSVLGREPLGPLLRWVLVAGKTKNAGSTQSQRFLSWSLLDRTHLMRTTLELSSHSLSLDESPNIRGFPGQVFWWPFNTTSALVDAASSDASRLASRSLQVIPCTLPLPPLPPPSPGLRQTVRLLQVGAVAARTKTRRPP